MAAHRFHPDKIDRLDSPARRERQPPETLAALVAGWAPSVVVDHGVGTGFFALAVAEALPEATIIGIDIEPRMLDVLGPRAAAAGVGDRLRTTLVSEADGAALPLGDGAADVVFSVALYHELEDRAASLREIHRVLAPGGRVLVCDWDPAGDGEHGPPLDHRVPVEITHAELEAAGFEGLERIVLYPQHYTLVGHR